MIHSVDQAFGMTAEHDDGCQRCGRNYGAQFKAAPLTKYKSGRWRTVGRLACRNDR
jgi:hypothetical protein